MNKLSTAKRVDVVAALVEGNSVRSTARMTHVSKTTILKLLEDLGTACSEYQDRTLRGLRCKRVQADEIWTFCYSKAKNVPADKRGQWGFGDVWTWTAIDADTKLCPSWLVGPRDAATAEHFMRDLASRLVGRIQLTTDGLKYYLEATEGAFGQEIDYSTLHKTYGVDRSEEGVRYSPPKVIGCTIRTISGNPDQKHVSTSYVGRANLTMRMRMRRFTRLTNGFSKKVENHAHMVALHFMHYNFCCRHQTLRVSPALAAGVTDTLWSIERLVELLDAA